MLRSEELSITTPLLDSTMRRPLHLDNGGDFAELCNAKFPKVCPKGDEMSVYKEGMGTQNVPNKTNCDGVSSIIFRCENGYMAAAGNHDESPNVINAKGNKSSPIYQ